MSILSRIFTTNNQPARDCASAAADVLFRRIDERISTAIVPFEATLGSRSNLAGNDLIRQCDVAREVFITSSSQTAAQLQSAGITAFATSEDELAERIIHRTFADDAGVFLLSPSGARDIRLASHLDAVSDRPMTICGSMVVDDSDAIENAESDAIIARIARSGAALCFASIQPVAARRLAARARKKHVKCAFVILPTGWHKVASTSGKFAKDISRQGFADRVTAFPAAQSAAVAR